MPETIYRPLKDLRKLPNNPRLIKDADFRRLCQSVKYNPDYFEARPVILSDRTGELVIIAGNMRYEAAKHLKLKEVPTCLLSGLDEAREREIVIRDNVSNGEFDWSLMANEWSDLPLADWGVDLPEDWLSGNGHKEEDEGAVAEMVDRAAELQEKWQVRRGDIFTIGRHRLMCGDSTSAEDVGRLVGGESVEMVFADPPYGVSCVVNSNRMKELGYTQFEGDESVDVAVAAFYLNKTLAPLQVWWGANHYADKLPPSRCWFVWDKDHPGMDFGDGELAWVSVESPIRVFRHAWSGADRDSEKGQARAHPNQKPAALAAWCFERLGVKSGVVVDLFVGAGGTMEAAERAGLLAYTLDKEPKYCAVTLERMSNLGLTPELLK